MDTNKVNAIVITEEDFDRAVMMNMAMNLQNPPFRRTSGCRHAVLHGRRGVR